MDKNQVTGLILMSLLLLVYVYFFSPTNQPVETQGIEEKVAQATGAGARIQEVDTLIYKTENDSLQAVNNKAKFGIFAEGATGEASESVLENEDLRITFSSKGAVIKSVLLKHYLTHDKKPLYLITENSSNMALLLNTPQGQVDLSALYFKVDEGPVTVGDTTSLTFVLDLPQNRSIRHTYTLATSGYQVGYDLQLANIEDVTTEKYLTFFWEDNIQKVEKEMKESRNLTTINYYTQDGDFDNLSETSIDNEIEELIQPIKWVAIKQKFFTAAIIADQSFANGKVSTSISPDDTTVVKKAEVLLTYPLAMVNQGSKDFTFFFGPNNYQILKKVTPGFSDNVYLGWGIFSWINKLMIIPIFNFLENYISNYGVIIIILVLFIKLLLSPLSYKSYLSLAKTKVLKPELDEIKERHKDDAQKAQAEQMQLYQKVGINPLSGCIPMLLQMPILLAMFNFFPNSIELRQESFLWAHDLSTYDSIYSWSTNIPLLSSIYGNHISLFTILMTASTILYTWSNSQMTSVQGPMKSMQYLMPIMFLFFLNSYSAGLTFYYFVSNIVTFGQQAIIKRFVDEDKIKRVLEENKKKNVNKKKSAFQQRLEDAMKAGQEAKKVKKK